MPARSRLTPLISRYCVGFGPASPNPGSSSILGSALRIESESEILTTDERSAKSRALHHILALCIECATQARLGVSELRRLRQLEEENRKLKQLVADLSLDKAMLQDVIQKKL